MIISKTGSYGEMCVYEGGGGGGWMNEFDQPPPCLKGPETPVLKETHGPRLYTYDYCCKLVSSKQANLCILVAKEHILQPCCPYCVPIILY